MTILKLKVASASEKPDTQFGHSFVFDNVVEKGLELVLVSVVNPWNKDCYHRAI